MNKKLEQNLDTIKQVLKILETQFTAHDGEKNGQKTSEHSGVIFLSSTPIDDDAKKGALGIVVSGSERSLVEIVTRVLDQDRGGELLDVLKQAIDNHENPNPLKNLLSALKRGRGGFGGGFLSSILSDILKEKGSEKKSDQPVKDGASDKKEEVNVTKEVHSFVNDLKSKLDSQNGKANGREVLSDIKDFFEGLDKKLKAQEEA